MSMGCWQQGRRAVQWTSAASNANIPLLLLEVGRQGGPRCVAGLRACCCLCQGLLHLWRQGLQKRERESERRVTEDREKSLREKKNEGERERRQHCRFAPWNLLPPWTPSPSLPLSTEGFGASGALMLGKACALHRLRRRAGARARRRYRALPGGT